MACRLSRIGLAIVAIGIIALLPARSISDDRRQAVYLIYDSSNSMWAALPDGTRKHQAAKSALSELMQRDFGNQDIAIRLYGHRRKNDCTDSELIVPFGNAAQTRSEIVAAVENTRPLGRTPIDLSLRQALSDFGDRSGSIILISDGIESCQADPCARVKSWRDQQIDITVHVVGLGLHGKERQAMQCIADAAGTVYRDAYSAPEILDGLNAALTPGDRTPTPDQAQPSFALIVQSRDGVRHRGAGMLLDENNASIAVETFKRYTPTPADYDLIAGIQVVGGEIYKPVQSRITVSDTGKTIGTVTAPRPPEVSATFSMAGGDIRATVVRVYRDGVRLGSFKGDASAFVPEGQLEFRTKPHGASKEIRVTASFNQGDVKTVQFDAAVEVHLTVIATATANGEALRSKPATELWLDGSRAHKINSRSGGLVTPGHYTLRIDDRLNRYSAPIEVSSEREQTVEITVPTGALTVRYLDSTGAVEDSKRVFITPPHGSRGVVRQSDASIALIPGQYTIEGWPKRNGYRKQMANISADEHVEVTLQATQ